MVSEQLRDLGMAENKSKLDEEHLKRLDKEISNLGVVFKRNNQRLQGVCTSLDRTEQMMVEMKESMVLMEESMVLMLSQLSRSKVDCKEKQVEVYGSPSQSSGVIIRRNEIHSSNSRENREAKMDFPYFSGEGPKEWLEKAIKYFQLHQTPDDLWLGIAKMHLDGKAYVWFYGFNASHPNVDWEMFSIELCKRFAENTGKEHEEGEENEPQVDEVQESEIESGCSFVKYNTSKEIDKPDYSLSCQFGNSLHGGIPPNAWSPKNSQNLGSHSNVGMLGFGNQLPVDIVSSTPGYISGFHDNVDGMDFRPVMENILQIPAQPFQPLNQALSQFAQMLSQIPQTSFQSSQQAFSQLHMEQPWNYIDCATAPSWFETENTILHYLLNPRMVKRTRQLILHRRHPDL